MKTKDVGGVEGRIIRILHTEVRRNQDGSEYALVNVMFDDGQEAVVIVGGEAVYFFHREMVKAYVKRNKAKH